jgi:hypothetical protein
LRVQIWVAGFVECPTGTSHRDGLTVELSHSRDNRGGDTSRVIEESILLRIGAASAVGSSEVLGGVVMWSENPNHCACVCHKSNAKPTRGVCNGTEFQANHRNEAEAVEAKQNCDSAHNSTRPISGSEKPDGCRRCEKAESQPDGSAENTSTIERVAKSHKSDALNGVEGEPDNSE